MSDEELDRDWKPNGRRPQSTMARSFSQELMDIFRIENSVSDLDNDINTRKQTVDKSNNELASLEARIKEMEDRLKRSQGGGPAAPSTAQARGGAPSQPATAAASSAIPSAPSGPPPPPPKDDGSKARSRPGTARAAHQAPSSGNMPPTPGASEDGHGE